MQEKKDCWIMLLNRARIPREVIALQRGEILGQIKSIDTRIIKTGQPWILLIHFKIQYAEKPEKEFLILKMIIFHNLDGYLPIQSTILWLLNKQ
jgi:hypothetical protein